jgi:hypothetical protein
LVDTYTSVTALTLDSADLMLYFYPLGVLHQIFVNFAPTKGTFTVNPTTATPMSTMLTLTFGGAVDDTLVLYDVYLYVTEQAMTLDATNANTFSQGILLAQA